MGKDEQAIRNLVATWMEATNAGDVARIVPLMADDVLFLTPGGPPFGRDAFVAGFTAFAQQQRINCTGELEEVVVAGDMAYARARLAVSITPRNGGETSYLAGFTLGVYRKTPDGRWVLARDANLVMPTA